MEIGYLSFRPKGIKTLQKEGQGSETRNGAIILEISFSLNRTVPVTSETHDKHTVLDRSFNMGQLVICAPSMWDRSQGHLVHYRDGPPFAQRSCILNND